MWIRSQDRCRLINSKNFGINFNSIITFNEEGLVNLGVYITEERAIEVLDKIQRHTEILERIKLNKFEYEKGCLIFEMPKS